MSKLQNILTKLNRRAFNVMVDDTSCRVLGVEQAAKIVNDELKGQEGLPISSVLTVSTDHITQNTFEALSIDGIRNEIMVPVYNVSVPGNGENFGLLIDLSTKVLDWDRIPEDLAPVMKLAMENDCSLLQFDNEGIILEELPTYESTWEE